MQQIALCSINGNYSIVYLFDSTLFLPRKDLYKEVRKCREESQVKNETIYIYIFRVRDIAQKSLNGGG